MSRKSSFSKKDLLEIAKGQFRDKSIGKLPLPPMLMIDRIIEISEVGGNYEKGYIKAEMDISDNNWFFECHFKNDPVMPGCLGLDGFWQLIGFFLSWAGGKGKGRALGVKDLKFKGQVRPYHDIITYTIHIRKFIKKPTYMAWGNATLSVNNKEIYFAKDLQVGLFEKLVWDTGMDPSVDPV